MESHWGGAKFSILECFLIHLVLWLRNKIAPAAGPVSSLPWSCQSMWHQLQSWAPSNCRWWALGKGRGGHTVNSCCLAQASAVCSNSHFFKQEHAGGQRTDKFVMELPAVQLSCPSDSSWTLFKPRDFMDCRDLSDFT